MLLLGSLSACSNALPWSYDTTHPVVATPDSVSVRLADAADKAAASLQSLAAIQQAQTPAPLPPATPADAHDELNRTMTVAWSGPAAPLLQRLATHVGYRFEQIGGTPTSPQIVTIQVIEQPIIEIMRDVGLQMGSKGTVVVDAKRHVVELDNATNH